MADRSERRSGSAISNEELHSSLKDDNNGTDDESPNEEASKQPCDEAFDGKLRELNTTTTENEERRTSGNFGGLLDIQAMAEMHGLLKKWGQVSYYVLSNNTLVLHLEDATASTNEDTIKEHVTKIVRRCEQDKEISVLIINASCEGILCSIGDTVFVNDVPQTIGMYVGHGGVVYWVSTAHGLLPVDEWNSVNYLCEKTARMHHAESEASQVFLTNDGEVQGGVDMVRIRAPTPYACLSYNPVSGQQGKFLMHYVDIMVGPMPLRTSQVEAHGSHLPASSLHEVRECARCHNDTCRDPRHDQSICQYAIGEILTLDRFSGMGYDYYDASNLMGKALQCRPRRQNIVFGEVLSYQNEFCTRQRVSDECRFPLNNVLVIKPAGRVAPSEGDSGSVWVLCETETAVAITVGKGKVHDMSTSSRRTREVWFAALLHPTFDAFCTAHPKLFQDPKDIKPVVPLSLAVTRNSVLPSSPGDSNTRFQESRLSGADSGVNLSQLPRSFTS